MKIFTLLMICVGEQPDDNYSLAGVSFVSLAAAKRFCDAQIFQKALGEGWGLVEEGDRQSPLLGAPREEYVYEYAECGTKSTVKIIISERELIGSPLEALAECAVEDDEDDADDGPDQDGGV